MREQSVVFHAPGGAANGAPLEYIFNRSCRLVAVSCKYDQTLGDTNGRFQLELLTNTGLRKFYAQTSININYSGQRSGVTGCDITWLAGIGGINGVGTFNEGYNNQVHGGAIPLLTVVEPGDVLKISVLNNAGAPQSLAATTKFYDLVISAAI